MEQRICQNISNQTCLGPESTMNTINTTSDAAGKFTYRHLCCSTELYKCHLKTDVQFVTAEKVSMIVFFFAESITKLLG